MAELKVRTENQPLTRYMKNWADTTEIKHCGSLKTLCGLTVNRSVMPNFSYTQPLAFMPRNRNASLKLGEIDYI